MSAVDARPASLLTTDEIELLRRGLGEWGGPAHANDPLARAMGFAGTDAMPAELARLRRALRKDAPMSSADWAPRVRGDRDRLLKRLLRLWS